MTAFQFRHTRLSWLEPAQPMFSKANTTKVVANYETIDSVAALTVVEKNLLRGPPVTGEAELEYRQ